MEDTFSVLVTHYQRNPRTLDKILDPAGNPIPDHEIGTFVFRVPTVADDLQMVATRQRMLAQVGDPQFVPNTFWVIAEAHAAIPRQVKEAPPGWDWSKLYSQQIMLEIYEAYATELEALRKKNPQQLFLLHSTLFGPSGDS